VKGGARQGQEMRTEEKRIKIKPPPKEKKKRKKKKKISRVLKDVKIRVHEN
jgi:hypothetical protein